MPYIVTHDGRTLPYPDPAIDVNDTVKINLETGRPDEFIKVRVVSCCFVVVSE
jgi:small subunit ribosomal protein S4e